MIDKELLQTTENQRMNKIKCRYRHKSLELVHVFSKKRNIILLCFIITKLKSVKLATASVGMASIVFL